MKKSLTVTIAGIIFTLEDDAYAKLDEYLDSIKKHFAAEDTEEILTDIESRIAERFSELLGKSKQAITLVDVEALIKEMGTVEEFEVSGAEVDATSSDSSKHDSDKSGKLPKKLYRNTDDKIIAGVASGIGAYFGVDPVFVRIGFILLTFVNGLGAIAYLILWFIVPEALSASQKMEMQGDPVTLKEFEKVVKKKVSKVTDGDESTLKKAFKVPFVIIGNIFSFLSTVVKKVFPLIARFIGVVLVFGLTIGIIALSFGMAMVLFNIDSPYVEFPIRELLTTGEVFIALGSAYVLVLIPLLFILFGGLSLAKLRSTLNGSFVAVLVGMWSIALIGGGFIASRIAPDIERYVEESPTITETIELDDFSSLYVRVSDDIEIIRGEKTKLIFEGRTDEFERRSFEVVDGELRIEREDSSKLCIGCISFPSSLTIVTPRLSNIDAAHSSNITTDAFVSESFSIDLAHSSKADVQVVADEVTLDLEHSSRLTLEGDADRVDARLRHSSHLSSEDFEAREVEADLEHSSFASVYVEEILNGRAKHSSHIRYSGDPVINVDTDSSSKVVEER